MKPRITSHGITAQIAGLEGGTITFTKFKMGNGNKPANYFELDDIGNTIATVALTDYESVDDVFIKLEGSFSNSEIQSAFLWTEIGIYIQDPEDENNDILYAYGHCELDDGQTPATIPASGDEIFEIILTYRIYVGEMENVTAIVADSAIYATKAQLDSHINNTSNPHEVTKTQVGLGNVPNVTTNNQTPTFTQAVALNNIQSGMTLSVTLGRISKAIADFITHVRDTVIHVTTEDRVRWDSKAGATHTHSGSDINEGKVNVNRGGTGKDTITKGAILQGNDASEIDELSGTGALFADTYNEPEFGVLPVTCGGTGKGVNTEGALLTGGGTSPIAELSGEGALFAEEENIPQFGTLPISFGGTGATTKSEAAAALLEDGATNVGDVLHRGVGMSGNRDIVVIDGGLASPSDGYRISAQVTAVNEFFLEFATGDDGTEPILFRQYGDRKLVNNIWSEGWQTPARTAYIFDSSGNTSFPNKCSAKSWGTVSDRKTKENIESLTIDNAMKIIMGIDPVTFSFKSDEKKKKKLGFIAQDVFRSLQENGETNSAIYRANMKPEEGSVYFESDLIDSEIIRHDDEELDWTIDYMQLIAPLVKIIQDHERRIEELEAIVKREG